MCTLVTPWLGDNDLPKDHVQMVPTEIKTESAYMKQSVHVGGENSNVTTPAALLFKLFINYFCQRDNSNYTNWGPCFLLIC